MAEQFEKAVEIGGLFVTAIQFLFTVTGKDQNRGAIIPDMVQGSRFVDCRLQRFQPSLVAGFEMSDYLAAERDDPGKLVGIFPITRQQLLIQSDHIDQISACRMAGNIDGGGVASVFSYIIEYPSNGGSGIYIYISSGSLTVSGGTVTANGGSGGGNGGDGISSTNTTISGGSTVTANGGNGGSLVGGDGIRSGGGLTVSDGTVTAKGGNGDSKDGYGGDGIRSGGVVTISGNTVNAAGGYGGKVGGYGICSFDRVAISGGTVEAAGGNGSTGGGSGIYSSVIDLSGSLELTAKAGSPNGKALSQNGSELVLDTIKDKLGPGAKVTATDADGKVIDQVSTPRPVEPEESSSSSDGGSSAPSAPASPLPGLTVTDKDGQRISYTSTQSGNTLTVCVGRFTASFRISLAALRQLRAEGIETITFQTILCSTTLSVDELLAMGGEDAEAVLTHRFTDSSLTVG